MDYIFQHFSNNIYSFSNLCRKIEEEQYKKYNKQINKRKQFSDNESVYSDYSDFDSEYDIDPEEILKEYREDQLKYNCIDNSSDDSDYDD